MILLEVLAGVVLFLMALGLVKEITGIGWL